MLVMQLLEYSIDWFAPIFAHSYTKPIILWSRFLVFSYSFGSFSWLVMASRTSSRVGNAPVIISVSRNAFVWDGYSSSIPIISISSALVVNQASLFSIAFQVRVCANKLMVFIIGILMSLTKYRFYSDPYDVIVFLFTEKSSFCPTKRSFRK